MLLEEVETLFGIVENTGVEEDDTAEDAELELDVTEEEVLEPDVTEEAALDPDVTEEAVPEPDVTEDELLTLAEDSTFEEDAACCKLLVGSDEAVSFAERSSSKLSFIVEFAGNSPLEQLVTGIITAKAGTAHIILFIN